MKSPCVNVCQMDPRRGFTTPNLMEAEANRALAEAARRVVVVADHTKWGVIGLCSILALDQADDLSDRGLGFGRRRDGYRIAVHLRLHDGRFD